MVRPAAVSHLDPAPDPFATDASDASDARWRGFNEFGVMLAVDGHWEDARQAFDDAVDAAPAFGDAPHVHAVLLSNLAQARFHAGDADGAIECARRSMAARVLCTEEDSAPMARIRSDLAVYLAASGALDEAQATLHHAIRSLEATFGAHDTRLLVPLENEVQFSRLTATSASATDVPWTSTAGEPAHAAERLTPESLASIDVFPSPRALDEANATDEYALEFVEELPPPPPKPTTPPAPWIGSGAPTAGEMPAAAHRPAESHGLGFEIQYGIPSELLLDGPQD